MKYLLTLSFFISITTFANFSNAQSCSSAKDYELGIKNGLKMAPPCKVETPSNKQSNLPVCQGSDTNRWNNCFGTVTFPQNKYVGEWKNGNFNGQGTMTWSDGAKYVGEWKDDERNGQGTMTWSDGTKYVGEWKDDKEHGFGTIYKNGKKDADGEFVNGVFADNNCGLRIKRKYELITSDKYTGQDNGRKIARIEKLVDYELGNNQQNPIYPKYGANNVYVYNVVFTILDNGRVANSEIRQFDCIVSPKGKIVGIERNIR